MQFFIPTLTTLLSLSSALPLTARWPTVTSVILPPSVLSQYSISTGAINYDTATGLVSKTGDGKDTSTLATFDIPPSLKGYTCSLHFYLDAGDSVASVSGSGLIDVYSSLKPAPAYDVPAWGPPGNQRDQHYGRLSVVEAGEATVQEGHPVTVKGFPCPGEGPVGFEIVGVYDQVGVAWDPTYSGLYLVY
ncbi:hypothetical protein BDV95DRAFT_559548 [Massariosphaeria phaeospora]|uniref:Ubiquitin 3 binding protein But2 C-terminal domain-containing protein n=1 Tax=Massariosphaeria phaeospora TaxID=100035 RepID=A0A7C8MGB0_9PLEO|nr:hypothetical protein BDV95DRAFT_559548 [Massariosphaeria phaeospora]